MPLIEEEIDGLSGLLFPFYDADTHMLYLAGKVVEDGGGKHWGSLWETPTSIVSLLLPSPRRRARPVALVFPSGSRSLPSKPALDSDIHSC